MTTEPPPCGRNQKPRVDRSNFLFWGKNEKDDFLFVKKRKKR